MPSVSENQRKFMAVCTHSPKHARGKCPPASVVREYAHADARASKEDPRTAAIRELSKGRD